MFVLSFRPFFAVLGLPFDSCMVTVDTSVGLSVLLLTHSAVIHEFMNIIRWHRYIGTVVLRSHYHKMRPHISLSICPSECTIWIERTPIRKLKSWGRITLHYSLRNGLQIPNIYHTFVMRALIWELPTELSASDLRPRWGDLCHVCTGFQQLGAEIYKEIPLFNNIIPPIV